MDYDANGYNCDELIQNDYDRCWWQYEGYCGNKQHECWLVVQVYNPESEEYEDVITDCIPMLMDKEKWNKTREKHEVWPWAMSEAFILDFWNSFHND